MAYRFVAPPNWPTPGPEWAPPQGWTPPSDWPSAPAGWQFWLEDPPAASPMPSDVPSSRSGEKVGLFGSRQRVRELSAEVDTLRGHLSRLGALDVVELERQRHDLAAQVQTQQSQLAEE